MSNGRRIRTERLELREIETKDAQDIVRWRSDPQVYQYFKNPQPLTMDMHLRWFENVYVENCDLIYWIGLKGEKPIGVFGAKKESPLEAEISYLVDRQFYKKGYAKEAVEGVCDWIALNWRVPFLIADVHVENIASQHFIETIGFIRYIVGEKYMRYRKKFTRIVKN